MHYDEYGKIVFSPNTQYMKINFYKKRILDKLWNLVETHKITYKMAVQLLADIEALNGTKY